MYYVLTPTDVHHYHTRKGKNFTSYQTSNFSTLFTACRVRNVAAVPTLAQSSGHTSCKRNPSTLKPSMYVLYLVPTVYVPAVTPPQTKKTHITRMAWPGMAWSTRMCFPGLSLARCCVCRLMLLEFFMRHWEGSGIRDSDQ